MTNASEAIAILAAAMTHLSGVQAIGLVAGEVYIAVKPYTRSRCDTVCRHVERCGFTVGCTFDPEHFHSQTPGQILGSNFEAVWQREDSPWADRRHETLVVGDAGA